MNQEQYEREIAEQWQYTEEFKSEINAIVECERGLSFSSLKAFLESPYSFYKYKTEKTTSKSMQDGIAFHMAVLQPDKFNDTFFVLDDVSKCAEIGGASPRSTKLYKEWYASQIDANQPKTLIKKDDYDTFMKMSNYLRLNSATKGLINGLKTTEDEFNLDYEGLLITGRIDGIGEDYIVDLKKVADASLQKVKWVIRDMLYDMQGAIYCMARKKQNYFLIFIDDSCECSVVKLCAETLAEGLLKFDSAINGFRSCTEIDGGFFQSYEFFNNGYVIL